MPRRFRLKRFRRRKSDILLRRYERKLVEALAELQIPLLLLNFALFVGTLGYMYLSGGDFINSLYMTVITIGTIGYGEVVAGSDTPIGRIFTTFLALWGIGIFTTSVTVIVRVFFKKDVVSVYRRIMMLNSIRDLRDHYIVTGYDEVTRWLVKYLERKDIKAVVITTDASVEEELRENGIDYYIFGIPYRDEYLYAAGIRRASGLVVNSRDDAEAIAIVSSARLIRPDEKFHIYALVSNEELVEKLYQMGASRVVDREQVLASRLVAHILHPESSRITHLFDKIVFAEESDVDIVELYVDENSPYADRTLMELDIGRKYGINVIGIRRASGELEVNVRGNTRIHPGDVLIIFGKEKDIREFREKEVER